MVLRMMMRGLLVAGLAVTVGFAVSGDAGAQTAKNLKCNGCVGNKDIGKNAVREKHIKKNAVTSSKIKNGTIKEEDLADSAKVGEVRQILSGGFNQGASLATVYHAPGWVTALQPTYPSASDGENAIQIRLPEGTLSRLSIRVRTATAATGGSYVVTVRINGADTALTCTVTGQADCTTAANVTVPVNDGDRLALEITSTLANEGNNTVNYSMLFR
jgi:hypothetical protein